MPPLALRAAGLPDQAAALEGLPEVSDTQSAARAALAVWAARAAGTAAEQAEHKCLADLVRARVPWAEIEAKISELQEKP